MSARRRAKVARLKSPLQVENPRRDSMLMDDPEWGVRLLLLALYGLKANSLVNSITSEDV